jgi:starch-binding outer membrane protein, SusD/RagB family
MRRRFSIFLGLTALAAMPACVDLDEQLVSGVSSQFYASPQGVEAAVNATYSHLRQFYGQESSIALMEFGSDIWTHGGEGGYKHFNRYDPGLNPSAGQLSQIWNGMYRGINTANSMLDRVDDVVGMNPTIRDVRVAEVRFLRAFFYFHLVRLYGDIPLSLSENRGIVTEMTRAPESEIYNVIISDLEAAIAALPPTQPQYGRATRGAAQHLLAQVHLTRAYRSFAQAGDFDRAAVLAETVINSGVYSLRPQFAQVFDVDNQRHSEVVFSVQFHYDVQFRQGDGNRYHLYYLSFYDDQPGLPRSLTYGRAWRRLRPTQFVYDLFDREKDARYDATFQHLWLATAPATGQNGIALAVGDTALWLPRPEEAHVVTPEFRASKAYRIFTPDQWDEERWPALLKHQDPHRPSINEEHGGREFMYARLAGTHLIAAEAHLGANRPDQAAAHLTIVRQRAAKPGFEADMAVSPAQVTLDFILDESARELIGEVNRRFDLVRTGRFLDRVREFNEQASPLVQAHHAMMPIPQSQIDNVEGGPAAFPQNPGY